MPKSGRCPRPPMASILLLLHSVFFLLHISSTFPTAVNGEGGGHGGVMVMRPPSSSPKIPHRYSVLSVRQSNLRSPRPMDENKRSRQFEAIVNQFLKKDIKDIEMQNENLKAEDVEMAPAVDVDDKEEQFDISIAVKDSDGGEVLALRNCLVEMDGKEGNLLGFITDAEVKELVQKVKDRVNNAKTPNRVNLEVAFRHSLIDGKTGETLGYLVPKEDLPNMELKADTHAVKLVRDRDTVNFEDALRWTFGIEGVKYLENKPYTNKEARIEFTKATNIVIEYAEEKYQETWKIHPQEEWQTVWNFKRALKGEDQKGTWEFRRTENEPIAITKFKKVKNQLKRADRSRWQKLWTLKYQPGKKDRQTIWEVVKKINTKALPGWLLPQQAFDREMHIFKPLFDGHVMVVLSRKKKQEKMLLAKGGENNKENVNNKEDELEEVARFHFNNNGLNFFRNKKNRIVQLNEMTGQPELVDLPEAAELYRSRGPYTKTRFPPPAVAKPAVAGFANPHAADPVDPADKQPGLQTRPLSINELKRIGLEVIGGRAWGKGVPKFKCHHFAYAFVQSIVDEKELDRLMTFANWPENLRNLDTLFRDKLDGSFAFKESVPKERILLKPTENPMIRKRPAADGEKASEKVVGNDWLKKVKLDENRRAKQTRG